MHINFKFFNIKTKGQQATHNIANGGDSSKLGHCSTLQTFPTVDTDAPRNRHLPYCQPLWGIMKNKELPQK